jgi:hypothetical protein
MHRDLVLDLDPDSSLILKAKLNEVLGSKSPLHVHVDKLAALLHKHRSLIDEASRYFQVLDPLIEDLESRVFAASDAEKLMLDLRQNRDNVKLLNDAYCAWETALEQIFSWRLRTQESWSLPDYRLNNRFQRLLQRETSMLRNGSPRRALFIGSGPFPISAMWLHRILQIPVDGLDISAAAVEGSRELLDKLKLSDAINILHADSETYDVSAYDVIIIALLAKPKRAILNNIARSAKDDCEVICRTSFGPRCLVYEPTDLSRDILEKFTVQDTRVIASNSDDTISSILLRKSVTR